VSVGSFFDVLIGLSAGVLGIYYGIKQKEKLGEKKAKLVLWAGILILIGSVIGAIGKFVR